MIYLIIGSCLASFFQCICQRNALFNLTRSKCQNCQHLLNPIDLLPIISYLIHRGKCHYCHHIIPIHYLWFEIMGATIFVGLSIVNFLSPMLSYLYALLLAWLFFMAIYDFYYYEISWSSLIILLFLGGTIAYIQGYSLVFPIWFWLCLEFIILIYPNSFGGADAKVFAILACTLPLNTVPYLLLFAALCGLVYFGAIKPNQQVIPFIPSIVIGYVLTLLIKSFFH